MTNPIMPDTDNRQIAVLAIAWQIVRDAYASYDLSGDELKRLLTNEVIEVYDAIYKGEKLNEGKK